MDAWQAALLGLIEGLTEYLPVSSTGHLIVTQRLLGLESGPASNAYAIVIQAGAIAAVLGLYRARVAQMIRGVLGRDAEGARLATVIVVAFLPAAVIGLLFDERIEQALFGPWPIVIAWFIGGVAILLVGRGRGPHSGGVSLTELRWRGALVIGLLQCVAMWPGTSRSLVTIVGGLVVGLSLVAAVEFSFLLGVVTLFAATAWQALHDGSLMLESFGWLPILIGCATACLSALFAVRWMVSWLQSHGLALFGWYRIVLAVAVAGLLLAGWI